MARRTAMLGRRGLPATWKSVGEEARMRPRTAAGRGRRTTHVRPWRPPGARLWALGSGLWALGFHTNGHSHHPTIAEYCSGAGWEEGRERVAMTEGPGLEAVRATFPDRLAVCHGQP